MSETEAVNFLRHRAAVHMAGVDNHGRPLLRAMHGIVMDGFLAFHGSPAGEKTQLEGQQVVISAEDIVAEIPSHFVDPVRACPATTYYRSVHLKGAIEPVGDMQEKARILAALMDQFQPEGGHAPILYRIPTDQASARAAGPATSTIPGTGTTTTTSTSTSTSTAADTSARLVDQNRDLKALLQPVHPTGLYDSAIRGLSIFRVSLAQLSGKSKLGQNRSASQLQGICAGLWTRGEASDLRAIELILEANPDKGVAEFMALNSAQKRLEEQGGDLSQHARLVVCPGASQAGKDDAHGAATLAATLPWNTDTGVPQLEEAHRRSTAWVALRSTSGQLIATVRATTDDVLHANIYDMVVHPDYRGRGVGARVMYLLLDHPRMRRVRRIVLRAESAAGFCRSFGFRPVDSGDRYRLQLLRS